MTMSDQIIAVMNDLCQKFGIAIDWSQENVLPYITELALKYIRYEVATSVAWIILSIFISLIIFATMRRASKADDMDVWFPVYMVGIIGLIIFGLCFMVQIFDIIECFTIPEKTIFEYVSALLRQK